MRTFQKITITATLALALTLNFSCSSDESDDGGKSACNNELFGCPYGNLSSSGNSGINSNNYGSQSLLGNAQYSATGNPPAASWAANETFSVNMDNTIVSGDSTIMTVTSSRPLEELYVQIGGNTGYYTMELDESNLVSNEGGDYVYTVPLQLEPRLSDGTSSISISGGSDSEASRPVARTVETLENTNNNNYGNQSLLDNAVYSSTGNPPASANWGTGTFNVNIGSTVISGGSIIATITSSRSLAVLYIQIGGNNGYYTVVLNDGNLVSSSGGIYTYSVVLQFNQSILNGAFSISFRGSISSTASTTISPAVPKNVETRQVGSGALQISLSWDKTVDLDLHVKPSWGDEIFFARKTVGNGRLDLDMICRLGNENVYFSEPLRDGFYIVYVNLYSKCGVSTPTKYVISAYANGEILDFSEENQNGQFAPSVSNMTKRTIGCISVTDGVIASADPASCVSPSSSSRPSSSSAIVSSSSARVSSSSVAASSSSARVSSSSVAATIDIGGIWNTTDGKRLVIDGNSWSYSQEDVNLSRGTWANGTAGKIIFTATQYYYNGAWADIPALLQQYKTNTLNISVNATVTTMTLSGSTAPALAVQIWGQIEGTYTKSGGSTPSSSSLAQRSSSSAVASSCVINEDDTIEIGDQVWSKNLNCEVGVQCTQNNCGVCSQDNCAIYGRLYNFNTAKKICPSGWHLPSDEEWTTLTNYVGTNPGTKLKARSGWDSRINGTDDYGFEALPGGRSKMIPVNASNGAWYGWNYEYVGNSGYWWSASGHRSMDFNEGVYGGTSTDTFMWLYSVRCVKD